MLYNLTINAKHTASALVLILLNARPAIASDYTEYFQIVNRAELHITDSSYAEALSDYELAFSKVNYSFVKDNFNAAVCAYLSYDDEKTITFITQSLYKGVSILEFQTCSFERIHKLKPFQKLIRARSVLESAHYKAIDFVLRREIDLLHAQDQEVRFRNELSKNRNIEEINKADRENFEALLRLFDKQGIPGENLVGTNDYRCPYFYILWHNVSNFDLKLLEKLRLAVLEGRFDRYDYSRLANSFHHTDTIYGTTAFYRIDDVLYETPYSEAQIATIDANRKSIGLETYQELKRKAVFADRDDRFLIQTAGIREWRFKTEEGKQKFISSLRKIADI